MPGFEPRFLGSSCSLINIATSVPWFVQDLASKFAGFSVVSLDSHTGNFEPSSMSTLFYVVLVVALLQISPSTKSVFVLTIFSYFCNSYCWMWWGRGARFLVQVLSFWHTESQKLH
jgi:hypothetical protein